jgi:AraC-like DNA-binding protein
MLSSGPSSFGAEVVARLKSESFVTRQLEPPIDFADSVQRILASYLPDGYLSLEAVAEISEMSPRTMQRSLAKDGLNFSRLVEKTRFNIANRMLVETESSSLDIAFATGYEDPSHFARAFKRLAGCSPREYRRRSAGSNREESGA